MGNLLEENAQNLYITFSISLFSELILCQTIENGGYFLLFSPTQYDIFYIFNFIYAIRELNNNSSRYSTIHTPNQKVFQQKNLSLFKDGFPYMDIKMLCVRVP